MKHLIILIMALMTVGCAKGKDTPPPVPQEPQTYTLQNYNCDFNCSMSWFVTEERCGLVIELGGPKAFVTEQDGTRYELSNGEYQITELCSIILKNLEVR